ncbi:Cbs domain-containing protein cbsx1 protein [Thalictrum thalictroides]|uniref:Cbs domain-containing protein cbsx1 protein n=1 Tax=Thalictrum thalictroides TaxID=46969 RepID=A0A7J6V2D4_THATH|nr:Cbs domain-containing protein cbsx1 protein [Thalictrum thalictroides]
MSSLIQPVHTRFHSASISTASSSSSCSSSTLLVLLPSHPTCFVSSSIRSSLLKLNHSLSQRFDRCRSVSDVVNGGALMSNSIPSKNGVFTVGDFMTKKELLHVVKPTTTIDEALEILVENRITGFPVIDDDWKLVGLVSDYDLLALDSVSGAGVADTSMFPEVDSSWKTFNEIQKLLSKTNGKVIADVMTPAPLVVRETTNLEDAARLLLETKYRRLPVVDSVGKLVGIITRGNVVRAALHIKREIEKSA